MTDPADASVRLRRGLPRTPGGPAWPVVETPVTALSAVPGSTGGAIPPSVAAAGPAEQSAAVRIRAGLPRVRGGEPWPASGSASTRRPEPARSSPTATAPIVPDPVEPATVGATALAERAGPTPGVRRGLPRVRGGAPWPDLGTGTAPSGTATEAEAPAPIVSTHPATGSTSPVPPAEQMPAPAGRAALPAPPEPSPVSAPATPSVAAPPVSVPTVAAPAVAAPRPTAVTPAAARSLLGGFRQRRWALPIGVLALVVVAVVLVLAARGVTTIAPFHDFLRTYPGTIPRPAGAPTGIPVWLEVQHFLSGFFLLLIIRTGLQVHREQRPPATWTSKRTGRKISLTVWFHQSLDLLWLLNGVVFVVLLFATGQWMRLVPTDWSILPNAIAALQHYVSLEWTTDDGWIQYNALQQLTYFVVVFIAAPVAALTGFRMSSVWPKGASRIERCYPLAWARALHYPTMLFFSVFIVIHVGLVLATGAFRNLNHMYGGHDATDALGFVVFLGSLAVMVVAWILARPLIAAPVAARFGKVSSR